MFDFRSIDNAHVPYGQVLAAPDVENLNPVTIELNKFIENDESRMALGYLDSEAIKNRIYSTLLERAEAFIQLKYNLDYRNGELLDPASGATLEEICGKPLLSQENNFPERTKAEVKAVKFLNLNLDTIGKAVLETSPTCPGHNGALHSMLGIRIRSAVDKVECYSILIPENSAESSLENMRKFASFFKTQDELENLNSPEALISAPTLLNTITNQQTYEAIFENGIFNHDKFLKFVDEKLTEITGQEYLNGRPKSEANEEIQKKLELAIKVIEETNLIELYELSLQKIGPLSARQVLNLILTGVQDGIKEAYDPELRAQELIDLLSDRRNLEEPDALGALVNDPTTFGLNEIGAVSVLSLPDEAQIYKTRRVEDFKRNKLELSQPDNFTISEPIDSFFQITFSNFNNSELAPFSFGKLMNTEHSKTESLVSAPEKEENTEASKYQPSSPLSAGIHLTKQESLPEVSVIKENRITTLELKGDRSGTKISDADEEYPSEENEVFLQATIIKPRPHEPISKALKTPSPKVIRMKPRFVGFSTKMQTSFDKKTSEKKSIADKASSSSNQSETTEISKNSRSSTQTNFNQFNRKSFAKKTTVARGLGEYSEQTSKAVLLKPKVFSSENKHLDSKDESEAEKITKISRKQQATLFASSSTRVQATRQTQLSAMSIHNASKTRKNSLKLTAHIENFGNTTVSDTFSPLQMLHVFEKFKANHIAKDEILGEHFLLSRELNQSEINFLKSIGLQTSSDNSGNAVILPVYKSK